MADIDGSLTLAGVPLSVLDLAPIPAGGTPGDALRATIALAGEAERLGFTRFWVAEHHGMPGVASSSPPVLIGHIAAATSRIRVGSGGVMLPNHTSLVIAEQFGMLEALHPGRIDLGIGRAPGTDQATAAALRHGGPDNFPRQLTDLLGFFTGEWPDGHPYATVRAVPGEGAGPDMWLLGSSGYSAQVAGMLGLPFAFAHYFSPANTLPALALYRESFRPSHILVELLLDACLTAERPDELHAYYQALATVDADWLEAAVGRMATGKPEWLAQFIPLFLNERFLWDYLDDGKLCYRLNQVLRRVGLSALPPAFAELLPDMRRAVNERRAELLSPDPTGCGV